MISEKSLLEMANGGFLERVDVMIPKIMENIMDPNTKSTAKRKLTIEMEIIPNKDRNMFTVNFTADFKPAPTVPLQTVLCITGDPSTGELCMVEIGCATPASVNLVGEELLPAIGAYHLDRRVELILQGLINPPRLVNQILLLKSLPLQSPLNQLDGRRPGQQLRIINLLHSIRPLTRNPQCLRAF